MTFLQLVQKLQQKTGAASFVSTCQSQTGEAKDYVDWINEAWLLIQAEKTRWKWMRQNVTFQTVAGQFAYLPTADVGQTGVIDMADWCIDDTWRCYKTATGKSDMSFLVNWDYQSFRDTFEFGLQSTILSKPDVFAVRDRDLALLFGQTPDDIYTIFGQYQTVPLQMAADTDVPGMPARFHLAIVYRAMQLYGKYEGAPEVTADGTEEYKKLYAALELDQLDRISLGSPLA